MALYAIPDGASWIVGDLATLFPNTSSPNSKFLADYGCLEVSHYKPHDPNTQTLERCLPYREGEWVYEVEVVNLSPSQLVANKVATDARARAYNKELRNSSVEAITVKISTGKTFDGDEVSQGRMSRAIQGMQLAGVTDFPGMWTLADNTQSPVTLAEITEAMVLAGTRQSELWRI